MLKGLVGMDCQGSGFKSTFSFCCPPALTGQVPSSTMNLALIPSLFFFFGLLSLVYAAALHYFLRREDAQVVDHWSLGALMWGVAILLTIFRAELPAFWAYFFANALSVMANAELNRGLKVLGQEHRNSPVRRDRDVFFFLSYLGLLYAIEWWAPAAWREAGKTSWVSMVIVFLSAQGAHYCFQIARRHGVTLARNLGFLFVIVALLWSARVVNAWASQGTYVFDPALVNTVIFTMIFITGILKYLAFPMLLLRKTDKEKQAQFAKTLARANKTVASGFLVASIAHELNQPLASIRINGQVLRKMMDEPIDGKLTQPEQVRLMIEGILSENDRAAKIIGSLRAIFSQSTVSPAQTDSAKQIQKIVDRVGQGMDKHQIRLELQLQKNLLVAMPEDEFQQVISNLLLNSMQALKEQASTHEKVILIESGLEGGQVFIAVSDNGPGVSKDMQDMLFNILSTTKDSGMGVGLWLCKYMVERYHGTLEHGSARLGGATFVLRLSPALTH